MLQIDTVSDLHIEFYQRSSIVTEWVLQNQKSKCLVLAGDIGARMSQLLTFLKSVSKHYDYVFYVPGNHDIYLETQSGMPGGLKKYEILKDAVNNIKNTHFLDGDVITVDGKKISGSMMWYSSDYYDQEPRMGTYYGFYSYAMNKSDYKMIPDTPMEIFEHQMQRLKNVPEGLDLFVSHIIPLINDRFFAEEHRYNLKNTFFSFDGSKYIHKTKNWIFGHTHTPLSFEAGDTKFWCNPYGYPNENSVHKMLQIQI